MLWIVLLAACSRTPAIESVSPAQVSQGATLTVHGSHFGRGTNAHLVGGSGERVPLVVHRDSTEQLEAKLPARVRRGQWTLVVGRSGQSVWLVDAVHVVPPREEPACTDAYTANTEISLARGEVVIDRYYPNGDKEHVRLGLDDVRRVELEHAQHADGPCNAIYLRTEDGRRVVFHDDRTADLRGRAWRVAQSMGKELEVVAPDGAAMSD